VLTGFLFAAVQPQGKQNTKGASVACQPLKAREPERIQLKRQEDAEGLFPDNFRLIKDHMTEAGADNGCHYHVDGQRIDIGFGFTFLSVDVIQDLLSYQEAQCKEQSIPAKFEGAGGKDLRAAIPNDVTK